MSTAVKQKLSDSELQSRQEAFISVPKKLGSRIGKSQDRAPFINLKIIPIDKGVVGELLEIVELPNKYGKKGATKPCLKLRTPKGDVMMDMVHTIKEALGETPQDFVGKNLFFQRKDERMNKKTKKMMQIFEVYEV